MKKINKWVQRGVECKKAYALSPKHCRLCSIEIEYYSRENDFCSRSCSAKFHNQTHNRKKIRICKVCSNNFIPDTISKSKKVCNNCKNISTKEMTVKIRNTTVKDYYSKLIWTARHPQYKWNHIRSFCRKWNVALISYRLSSLLL